MNKVSKLLLTFGGAATAIIPAVAVSCTPSDNDKKIKDLEKQLADTKAQLTTAQTDLTNKTQELTTAQTNLTSKTQELADAIKRYNTVSLTSSNTWNSISAEKEAMGMEVYKQATAAFDAMITQPNVSLTNVDSKGSAVTVTATEEGKFIPVVFMDLDETVLNNFAYQNYLVKNNTTFSLTTWHDFVMQAKSQEVAGAIKFIKHVWEKGGVVMFNSNRNQNDSSNGKIKGEVEASKTNLVNLGLDAKLMPEWIWWMQGTESATPQKPFSQANRDVKVSKEERMHYINTNKLTIDKVQAQFKVVMRVGDDISDFNDNFSKQQGIKSAEVVAALKDANNGYGILFGNTDVNNKSVYFNIKTNKFEKEDFAASYILIPGNTSYGSWVKQAVGSSAFNFDKANELLAASGWVFTPSAPATTTTGTNTSTTTPAPATGTQTGNGSAAATPAK
ncbi:HAD family acid phosphatase [Mycoplasma seminis]|uniref:HAD family acid phosphatase n=1 Tax=Mycoplasma seminis TaxID=512749 RepID=A0ABY9HAD3_9MOLU|nr:HAD family acid phosphatase [Mycoplasma seminis]WLP85552.1 HAD family acid phosphatase [Mycoplasma seminis]